MTTELFSSWCAMTVPLGPMR